MKAIFNFKCNALWITPCVLLAAGCASSDRGGSSQARYDETLYPTYSATASASSSAGATGSAPEDAGTVAGSTTSSNVSTTTFYSSDIFSTRPEDNALVSQIRQKITEESRLAAVSPSVQIGANAGTVALFGRVNTPEEKQRVEEIVRQTSGVVAVDNNLEIGAVAGVGSGTSETLTATSRSDGETVSDTTVRSGVSGSAMQSGGVTDAQGQSGDLSATSSRTNGASAIYSGTGTNQSGVETEPLQPTSRTDAESQSSQTNSATDDSVLSPTSQAGTQGQGGQTGGVNVNVSGSSQADRTLAQQIGQELRSDSSLASAVSQVSISVVEGRVTLRGTVKNEVQKREIEAAIQRATGVSSVDNQLRVGAPGSETPPREF